MLHPNSDTSSAPDAICIHGAREHNLKNLSVAIPRGKFVVVTGVSGSGKSTLAFDLIFAEGQRRFLDSMNAYARQFVEQMSRPDVDLITGIPPTVSIEQRNSRGGGKSTVATVTEIYHFLRLLFARLGTQYCPDCQVPVEAQTRDQVGRRLHVDLKKRGDLLLLAPVVKNRKGFHTDVAEWAARHGYAEVRADGKIFPTNERLRLDRFREHNVEIVVGVLEKGSARVSRAGASSRRANAASPRRDKRATGTRSPQQLIDEALQLGHGILFALDNHGEHTVHSTERSCPKCGRSFEPLDPKNFSYNSSQGWCPKCRGFGELFYLPEAFTDFIYAVIGEELGFLGCAAVLAGFMIILWRGLQVCWLAPDDFGRYLALGVTSSIVIQAMINISVVLDMGPTKGIPLPMISAGGSSLLSTLMCLGMLLSVSEHSE